ncbi:unnamed protein product [Merluccius merluccius]
MFKSAFESAHHMPLFVADGINGLALTRSGRAFLKPVCRASPRLRSDTGLLPVMGAGGRFLSLSESALTTESTSGM